MKLLKGIWIGIWSGLLMALLLKWIEAMTSKKVYTLLLNVDFIPVIEKIDWSEAALLSFHLGISVVLGVLYVFLAKREKYTFGQLFLISLFLCSPLLPLYFPLAALSVQEAPGVWDIEAFLYWTFGHLAYMLALPVLYKMFERKNAASQ